MMRRGNVPIGTAGERIKIVIFTSRNPSFSKGKVLLYTELAVKPHLYELTERNAQANTLSKARPVLIYLRLLNTLSEAETGHRALQSSKTRLFHVANMYQKQISIREIFNRRQKIDQRRPYQQQA